MGMDPITWGYIASTLASGAMSKMATDAQTAAMKKQAKQQEKAIEKQTKAIKEQPVIGTVGETTTQAEESEILLGSQDVGERSDKKRKTRLQLMNQGNTRTGGTTSGLYL